MELCTKYEVPFTSGTCWVEGWAGLRASLDALERSVFIRVRIEP